MGDYQSYLADSNVACRIGSGQLRTVAGFAQKSKGHGAANRAHHGCTGWQALMVASLGNQNRMAMPFEVDGRH